MLEATSVPPSSSYFRRALVNPLPLLCLRVSGWVSGFACSHIWRANQPAEVSPHICPDEEVLKLVWLTVRLAGCRGGPAGGPWGGMKLNCCWAGVDARLISKVERDWHGPTCSTSPNTGGSGDTHPHTQPSYSVAVPPPQLPTQQIPTCVPQSPAPTRPEGKELYWLSVFANCWSFSELEQQVHGCRCWRGSRRR